jgi:hypothetical protein
MEQLEAAVVDITLLIATRRALRGMHERSAAQDAGARWRDLGGELKQATVAYLGTLARSPRGVVDDAALALCRRVAEDQMPRALEAADELRAMMQQEDGALEGLTIVRHDLWHLARIATHARGGTAALRGLEAQADHRAARKVARPLQRQLRRALLAYAQASLRSADLKDVIRKARRAAVGQLTGDCVDEADALARLEAELEGSAQLFQRGVARPLRDLLIDWHVAA